MQNQLNQGYYQIAAETGIEVIPVGLAWRKGIEQAQPLDLWQSDGSHPNPAGTYLAASVFYAAIFKQSPEGLEYRASLNQETAEAIQSTAAETLPVK
jgi:hypothetical protein